MTNLRNIRCAKCKNKVMSMDYSSGTAKIKSKREVRMHEDGTCEVDCKCGETVMFSLFHAKAARTPRVEQTPAYALA